MSHKAIWMSYLTVVNLEFELFELFTVSLTTKSSVQSRQLLNEHISLK